MSSLVSATLVLAALHALPCDQLAVWQQRAEQETPTQLEQTFGPFAVGQRAPDGAWLKAQLAARCALAAQPTPVLGADDGEPTVASILARPEFEKDSERGEQLLALLKRLWQWVTDRLDRPGITGSLEVMRYLVLAGAAGIALYGLYRGVRRFARRQSVREHPGEATAAPLALLAPDGHLARARALLETEPRAALRESLLALLSTLERRRWARPDRVKTNRELAAELGASSQAPAPLGTEARALLTGYDAAFYSLQSVQRPFAEAFLGRVVAFERAVSERAA